MDLPIIIDFEASGFGKNSYPIEVGFVAGVSNSWCSLIKPDAHWRHWDLDAAGLHHITPAMLASHGRSPVVVADRLNAVLQGQTAYTDGWLQDFVWMSKLFDAAQRVPRFKLEDLRLVLTQAQQAIWHATKEAVLAELHFARHRASNDAKVLQLTWRRTYELTAAC